MKLLTTSKVCCSLLVLYICFWNGKDIQAQDEPSSDQIPAGFGVNALQTSENLSSGVLNINLPIESHILPISLNYTTSGIKVSQRASIVGLGWNLTAGGEITRQVRGQPDDYEEGYSGLNQRGQYVDEFGPIIAEGQNNNGLSTVWDSEPDLYSFNFLGHGGMFTLDYERNVIKLTPNNFRITAKFVNASTDYFEFTIVDEQGNTFLFDKREEVTTIRSGYSKSYDRKWHLTQITQYQTGYQVDLAYERFEEYTETNIFRSKTLEDNDISKEKEEPVDEEVDNSWTPWLLSQIVLNETQINFDYSSQPSSGTQQSKLQRLDHITYSTHGVEVQKYTFEYKHSLRSFIPRMMLAGVTKSTLDVVMYQFTYFGEQNGETLLPDYNSIKQDHWGFYNDNTALSSFPVDGANKEPSLPHTRSHSLKKIYDAFGSYQEFDYELNQYHDGSNNQQAGGLRIAHVFKGEENGDRYKVKSYQYDQNATSSGHLYAIPQYSYSTEELNTQEPLHSFVDIKQYSVHRDRSMEQLTDPMGRHIAYKYVKVIDANLGYTQTQFHVFEDDKSVFETGVLDIEFMVYGTSYVSGYDNSESPGPFGSRKFSGSTVGLPKVIEVRRDDEALLSKEQFEYEYDIPDAKNAWGFHFLKVRNITNEGELSANQSQYLTGVYDNKLGQALLIKKYSTSYESSDESKSLTVVTDYIYHSGDYTLLDTQTTYRLGGEAQTQSAKTDYVIMEVDHTDHKKADEDHIVQAIDKRFTYINGEEVSKIENVYYTDRLRLKNQKSYVYESGNPYLIGDINYKYDGAGKVVEILDNLTGKASSQIWDRNGTVVVASINNAEVEACAYSSFEDVSSNGWAGLLPVFTLEQIGCVSNEGIEACKSKCAEPDNDCFALCDRCAIDPVNISKGIFGDYAYQLEKGSLSKYLPANDTYLLSYWKKEGTLSVSNLSANDLVSTKRMKGWTFEKRIITKNATAGAITISGTAVIDELKIYPKEALMTSLTFNPALGKTSETDVNDQMIFYEHDEAGRVVAVRDINLDILSSQSYHIAPFLNVDESKITAFPYAGSSQLFIVSNATWTITDDVDWISVSPSSGDRNQAVTVAYSDNFSDAIRTGNITIAVAGVNSAVVPLEQELFPESELSSSTTSVFAGTTTVLVESTVPWTATVKSECCIDIDLNGGVNQVIGKGDGSFSITKSGTELSWIEVKTYDNEHSIIIWAYPTPPPPPSVLSLSESFIEVGYHLGRTNFDITSNIAWEITETANWFSVNPTNGNGDQQISISYDANIACIARSGNLIVSATDQSDVDDASMTLRQNHDDSFCVSSTTVSTPATIRVDSEVSWSASISTQPSGGEVTLSNFTGTSGDGSFKVNYTHFDIEERESDYATVEVTTISGKVRTVVVQPTIPPPPAPILSVNPSSIDVTYSSGTATLNVNSNVAWQITESTAWLSVSPTSGQDNESVTIYYGINNTKTTRSSEIKISASGSGVSDALVSLQQGFDATSSLSVSPTSVGSAGGTIQVYSNTSWSARISSQPSGGMLSLSSITGTAGDGSFRISYSDNGIDEGGNDYGAVEVSTIDGKKKTIVVTL
ncbi:MAG: BACON domain-containing protein [Reichenbachiella sp.]|uniref:BACON domain-containing protein n=1 Tax=Reichenbachiella sp. TaxID=2184521 RepID=UPI003265D63B